MDNINVYVKINRDNLVTDINSQIFIGDVAGWVLIDSGEGDKFVHASSNYLNKPIFDEMGRNNYKLDGNSLVELTENEKASLFPTPTPQPTLEEQIKLIQDAINDLILGGM